MLRPRRFFFFFESSSYQLEKAAQEDEQLPAFSSFHHSPWTSLFCPMAAAGKSVWITAGSALETMVDHTRPTYEQSFIVDDAAPTSESRQQEEHREDGLGGSRQR